MQSPLQARLLALRDEPYGVFQRRLLPTVPPERILGVRTPALRALAAELSGTPEAAAFLAGLPHTYFEENNLHAFLLERLRDPAEALAAVESFLPYVDNWATCDQLRPPALRKGRPALLARIPVWLASPQPYTVRFGLGMLMAHFLDEDFRPDYLEWAAAVTSGEYYVNMMAAWYFATALAKQYGAALPYLEGRRLAPWVHNKAIQKALESRRITPAQKAYLRGLKNSHDRSR